MTAKALCVGLIATLLMAACGGATAVQSDTAASQLKVVATYSILRDLVQNVGGDEIELRTLVGPGADTHEFEPTPADGVALAEAALIFENGLGFETWLNDLYAASDSKATRIVVTKGVEPLAAAGDEREEGEAEHESAEFDPHVWHDVAHVMRMVEAIRDALGRADPAHAETYTANADAYLAQLRELDAWVFDQVATLPENRRKLVTSHDTFSYFAERYGFVIVGVARVTVSTGVADPSAGDVAALVEAIQAADVPAIFAENVSNPKLMEQIANAAEVVLAPALYTDALGQPGSAGDTYLKMMRYNVTTVVAALSQ